MTKHQANVVNVAAKMREITEHWKPRVAGQLNGQEIKLVKFEGEFVWHHHESEDELFLVTRGEFDLEFRDHTETVRAGEFIIVPRGVEHRPVARSEVEVLLFEPAGTRNTGNVVSDLTAEAEPI